jgi:hypothetical protein
VTPYAAGCAVCGTDIAAARSALAQRRVSADRVLGSRAIPRFRLGDDGLRIAIALLLALAAPLFGLLLSCYFAWQTHNEGRTTTRNILLLVALVAALPMITGYSLWGRFLLGY